MKVIIPFACIIVVLDGVQMTLTLDYLGQQWRERLFD